MSKLDKRLSVGPVVSPIVKLPSILRLFCEVFVGFNRSVTGLASLRKSTVVWRIINAILNVLCKIVTNVFLSYQSLLSLFMAIDFAEMWSYFYNKLMCAIFASGQLSFHSCPCFQTRPVLLLLSIILRSHFKYALRVWTWPTRLDIEWCIFH